METRYEEEGLKERTREIEKSIIKRFRKEIWRPFAVSYTHLTLPTKLEV